ncbi:hypothetical protein JL721_1129 [Aureococcus anophagefferens]|nr:hypothetical protein JL721_1129 [Aureococcus anophagefferens]
MDAAARLVAKFRTASAQDLAPALLFGGAYFFFNRLAKLAQRWMQRRKAAPRSRKAEGTKAFYILGGLLAAALGVQGLCYYRYGPLFFVAEDAKKLDWTGADWRAALENRTVAPASSTPSATSGSGAKPPIAEASVLLEKSPPNAVLARYLQAVVDFPTDRRAAEPAAATTCAAGDKACDKKLKKKKRGRRDAEEFAPAMPAAPPRPLASLRVFVSRHPIANAVSHQYVTTGLAIPDLVAHWIAVATYAKTNEAYLAHVVSIRLEDFCASPAAHLLDLWAFLGLEGHDAAMAAAAASPCAGPQRQAQGRYAARSSRGSGRRAQRASSSHFGDQIERDHNYDRDWC